MLSFFLCRGLEQPIDVPCASFDKEVECVNYEYFSYMTLLLANLFRRDSSILSIRWKLWASAKVEDVPWAPDCYRLDQHLAGWTICYWWLFKIWPITDLSNQCLGCGARRVSLNSAVEMARVPVWSYVLAFSSSSKDNANEKRRIDQRIAVFFLTISVDHLRT